MRKFEEKEHPAFFCVLSATRTMSSVGAWLIPVVSLFLNFNLCDLVATCTGLRK